MPIVNLNNYGIKIKCSASHLPEKTLFIEMLCCDNIITFLLCYFNQDELSLSRRNYLL